MPHRADTAVRRHRRRGATFASRRHAQLRSEECGSIVSRAVSATIDSLSRIGSIPGLGAISPAEKAAARGRGGLRGRHRRAPRRGAATSKRLIRISGAVRRQRGAVQELELAPAAVIATVKAGSLPRLAGARSSKRSSRRRPRGDCRASAPPQSAPRAGGLLASLEAGTVDSVPADVAIESEALDPDHPAFAAVIVDNDPSQPVTDHGTHTGGIIASNDGTYPGVARGVDNLIGSGSTASKWVLNHRREPAQ